MKKAIALLAISTAFISGAFAQTSSDGFSVGGVGELGGTAVNPVTENGWSSLNDYRTARDCCGYTNTGSDAQLWTDATNADANSPAQIANANCAAANYQALRSACTGQGAFVSLSSGTHSCPCATSINKTLVCLQTTLAMQTTKQQSPRFWAEPARRESFGRG